MDAQIDSESPEAELSDGPDRSDIARTLGANLRRLRTRRGLSLERLARLSGVSRAMLGQIELGRSVPTILLLDKVAKALEAPLTAFVGGAGRPAVYVLRREQTRLSVSPDGGLRARNLDPPDIPATVHFEELRLRPGAEDRRVGAPPETMRRLALVSGDVEVSVASETFRLREGDAAVFDAERGWVVRNIGRMEALLYAVTTDGGPGSKNTS
ncbi:MAG TPA: helix-turn-helix domain-containing protein [Azospirillaceae bacterium]|nr:helix-turn-helix domain-containing protein [Azospirillaceae bacterium]HRQ81311.1 helix-turn-helix domain-containing protein [Azospirillaceae bacterium]